MRRRLDGWAVRPKKRFGQHFILSRGVLEKIVDAAEIASGDSVVEVGPGLGDLTQLLAEKAESVLAIEVDRGLAEGLQTRFCDLDDIEILCLDVLRWPLPDGLEALSAPRKIVGNLPYNIGTQILLRLIDYPALIDGMALMFQKEVALRLTAKTGSPEYGAITLLAGLDWEARIGYRIPASAFHPKPKVDSALVCFRPRSEPCADVGDRAVFRRLVKAAFGQRRKTLRNALKALRRGRGGDWVDDFLEDAGIDGTRRGETLTIQEFAALSRSMSDVDIS